MKIDMTELNLPPVLLSTRNAQAHKKSTHNSSYKAVSNKPFELTVDGSVRLNQPQVR